ncbi:ABC transporter substrate-binding protein [Desulfosporosinus sp. BICA1-9]|uniref:ABC transporter substrate-binding protein n=1 Tax=Desulfosporosinus sp. BICA1-9 TaxID=1531958 RepID=UPI00054B95B7|nr:ABC transporter substrate-binding protein [Desulfosporosinus sp. BICA1-9]KJS47609.1 MAG: ethanolamine utilization protein EutJ [Peptococcaceae bacterium BRH_c23]KJS89661.1 MAG: ethanolamine utilization protein EutJ [Desulfosporosinus sp. BICA1-9]HBW37129.1 ethanolamine utilization protein EutJ [Desulfosporosinus sp.]
MRKSKLLIGAALLMLGLVSGCGSAGAPKESAEIKIGGNLELSGGVATYGQSVLNSVTLAFEDQNKKGGVLGKQLKFVTADNKSEAGESTAAITKLITQDKVVAVLGAVTSSNTKAAVPVSADNKIPLITPTATNSEVTINKDGSLNKWVFRSCFLDPFQGKVAANFVLNTLKVNKAALFIDQKDDYSKGLAAEFKKVLEGAGGSITETVQYVGGDKDFKSTLTRIKASNPEVVFVPGYYNEVGLIVKQARELGIKVPFVGGDGWDSAKLPELAGAANLNDTYFVNHMWAEDPATKPFVEAYKAKFNAEPDALAALGYDAAKLLIAAIEKAGSTDPEKLRTALENTKDFNGVTGIITVDPATHNPVKSAVIIKMVDGKKTLLTHVNP